MNFSETHKEHVSAGTPKISVIVPVYKVEKYLAECIESVLAQTFRDFELILVDDGSPDDCGKICDDYAARDSRVRVFHKENGGVTSARRLGVERSRADWITFVDADDIIFPNALADLLNIVETEEKSGDPVDLAQMGIVRFSGVPEIAYAKTGGGYFSANSEALRRYRHVFRGVGEREMAVRSVR